MAVPVGHHPQPCSAYAAATRNGTTAETTAPGTGFHSVKSSAHGERRMPSSSEESTRVYALLR
jgi:hypothetical protein